MKTISLTSTFLALALATPALSATIYSARPLDGSISIVDRFADSSFDYDAKKPDLTTKDFCFVGELKDVCDAFQKDAAAIVKAYVEGGHDSIEVLSCTVGEYSVNAKYRLTDDWASDLTVEREISSCGIAGAKATILQASLVEGQASLSSGLYSSIDDKSTSLCYSGKRDAVCGQIKAELALIKEEYLSGAHDYQQLNSCSVDKKTGRIKAAFSLFNDYTAKPSKVSHQIDACSN